VILEGLQHLQPGTRDFETGAVKLFDEGHGSTCLLGTLSNQTQAKRRLASLGRPARLTLS
jgi:hypothetical protein